MRHRRSGLDELLIIARNLSESPHASTLEEFSSAELLAIGRAHLRSEWDIYPGSWSSRQLKEAIAGVVPRFREEPRGMVPVHHGANGADVDGHCQRCGELNDMLVDCPCPVVRDDDPSVVSWDRPCACGSVQPGNHYAECTRASVHAGHS